MRHFDHCPQRTDPTARCFCPPGLAPAAAGGVVDEDGTFRLTPPDAKTTVDGDPINLRGETRSERDRRLAKRRWLFMQQKYGKGPAGLSCGTCLHLRRPHHSGKYFKCALYGISSSEATDWRAKWPTCGRYVSK